MAKHNDVKDKAKDHGLPIILLARKTELHFRDVRDYLLKGKELASQDLTKLEEELDKLAQERPSRQRAR